MTQHEHHDHQHHQPKRKGLHKDWRAWFLVILMLGAMAIYILTMDESIQPGNPVPGQPVPAAPPPPPAV